MECCGQTQNLNLCFLYYLGVHVHAKKRPVHWYSLKVYFPQRKATFKKRVEGLSVFCLLSFSL